MLRAARRPTGIAITRASSVPSDAMWSVSVSAA
jgi:hypothetical protein